MNYMVIEAIRIQLTFNIFPSHSAMRGHNARQDATLHRMVFMRCKCSAMYHHMNFLQSNTLCDQASLAFKQRNWHAMLNGWQTGRCDPWAILHRCLHRRSKCLATQCVQLHWNQAISPFLRWPSKRWRIAWHLPIRSRRRWNLASLQAMHFHAEAEGLSLLFTVHLSNFKLEIWEWNWLTCSFRKSEDIFAPSTDKTTTSEFVCLVETNLIYISSSAGTPTIHNKDCKQKLIPERWLSTLH